MPQEQIKRTFEKRVEKPTDEQVHALGVAAIKNDVLDQEVDDLLDEIDIVLESNAEEFVKNYIQKGGQ